MTPHRQNSLLLKTSKWARYGSCVAAVTVFVAQAIEGPMPVLCKD